MKNNNITQIIKEIKTELSYLHLQTNIITKQEYISTIKKLEKYIESLEKELK